MLTLTTAILAATLLAQSPDSIILSGVVVDAAGKPLSDVEVVLPARRPGDGSLPTLSRGTTDEKGSFRLEIVRQRFPEIAVIPFLWAYRPGLSVAVQRVAISEKGAMPPVRLTLAEALPRTVQVLGPDDRPLVGARVTPIIYSFDGNAIFQTPDDRLEHLAVTGDADGVVKLPYFPATIDPITVRVSAPGIAPHQLGLPDRAGRDRITLKLGRPARLAGTIYNDLGQPASRVPIEVWVSNTYEISPGRGQVRMATQPAHLTHFDSGPVLTGADGSFLTPPQLLTGSSYRIIVRAEGSPPVTSDWLMANTELTTFPPLRLRQRRKLVGLVHDRQGKPVAGARVFLPSGEPSTTTDSQGRYVLEGILPDKTYLLVKAEGYRFQGFPGIPAREPQERTLILVRTSEPPDRTMAPLPPPISSEESRALARRVMEPSLQTALEKGDLRSKFAWLRVASRIDPGRVLELLEQHPLQNLGIEAAARTTAATELLTTDPKESEAVVNAIADPEVRAWAYVSLADALPDHEQAQKRGFLELASAQVRILAAGGVNSQTRVNRLGQLAGGWLNVGEVDKARPLIREGLDLAAKLPATQTDSANFLPIAARIEPDRVLSLIRGFSSADIRRSCYAAVAVSLANEHPAEAERVFELIDDSSRISGQTRDAIALRLCRGLAKTDPQRARRIIAGLKTPQDQACGWALLALGLAEREKPAAQSALDESIRAIDRLVDPAGAVRPPRFGISIAANPAASILPIVEKVAPDRLEEVFWKAVALVRKTDPARQQQGFVDYSVIAAAIFLARYDRQVADVFVTQAMSSQSRSRIFYSADVIRAKAGVDPHGAVTLMEAVPAEGLDRRDMMNQMTNEARVELVVYLVEPSEYHWKYIWTGSGIPLDERTFP